MTPEQRAAHADMLLNDTVLQEALSNIETSAIEALIHAKDEQSRVEAQWRVRAARAFRSEIEAMAVIQQRKGAPA